MSDTILVTGATGNVGEHVVRALLARGATVRAAARDAERIWQTFGGPPDRERLSAVALDLADPASYADALAGCTGLFLMRPPAISDTKHTLVPFVQLAQRMGVQRVAFLSLIGIEQRRYVPHYAVEEALRASTMDWTMLRAGFFMQNLDTTHRDEIRHGQINVPVGDAPTAFVDARDLAAVAALALTAPSHAGQAYDLTGGEALTYDQVAAELTRAIGRPVIYTRPSLWRFARQRRRAGDAWPMILVMALLYASTRRGMAAEVTTTVEELLGRPPITLAQYARDYAAKWRKGA